jgi:hypothetical protein
MHTSHRRADPASTDHAPLAAHDALRTGSTFGRRGVGVVVDARRLGEEWILRLCTQPGWHLAFACSNLDDALAEMRRRTPALLLVDLALADGAALALLREAGRHWPECVAAALIGEGARSLATLCAPTSLPLPAKATSGNAGTGPGVLWSWGDGL